MKPADASKRFPYNRERERERVRKDNSLQGSIADSILLQIHRVSEVSEVQIPQATK